MTYTVGQSIHVLSIINNRVIYWYTGQLLARGFQDNNILDTVWYIRAQDGQLFKIDTTKTITVLADTYKLPTGTFTAEQICEFAQIAYSPEITALNMFPIMNINFNTSKITMKTEGDNEIILPLTEEQLVAAQNNVNAAVVLANLHDTVKKVVTEEEATARILLEMKGVSVAASQEMPSLFIQFDYK